MKIIIIGAGVAGLTMGLACQRAGMDVKIYDKAKELRSIGGGILLWPHGLRFLDELGLADCYQPALTTVKTMNILSSTGRTLMRENSDGIYSMLDGEILPIDRSLFQQLLVSKLKPNTLKLNAPCVAIANQQLQASAIFADGSSDQADLIVGADGVNSVVRAAINPAAKPSYNGFCWWGGVVESKQVPRLAVGESHYFMGQGKICSIWPMHGEKFMWYLPVKMSLSAFTAASDYKQLSYDLCSEWNDDVQCIISAPQTAQTFHLPIYELAPRKNCSTTRVTLIGDAATTSGPLLGQGANRAIEDAYLLATLLRSQKNDLSDILAYFDELRYARHQRVFELEHMSADALIQETPEDLEFFEAQIPHVTLAMMYQDMIPLVNAKACASLRKAVTRTFESEVLA